MKRLILPLLLRFLRGLGDEERRRLRSALGPSAAEQQTQMREVWARAAKDLRRSAEQMQQDIKLRSERATLSGVGACDMSVILELTLPLSSTNVNGEAQVARITLKGTPAKIQAGIEELFDADRANDLRRELGLNVTSASAASGRQ